MDRFGLQARGLFTGWALGLWEAGLNFAANANFIHSPVEFLIAPIGPTLLYGWGGWLLAALPFGSRLPWSFLYFLGAALLLLLHLGPALAVNAHWLPLGALASVALWGLGRRLSNRGSALTRRVGQASLAAPAVAALALLAFGGRADLVPQPRSAPAPQGAANVVLVTWDTVRADTLPLFGGGGLDTPELDRLAAEGTLFTGFQAVAPITAPAHLSMLTGLYPPSHGVRANGEISPDLGVPRLPELFAAAGYATGGFVSGHPLRASFGFGKGFQVFDDRPAATPLTHILGYLYTTSVVARRTLPRGLHASSSSTAGAVTLGRALRWLEATDGPVFLWVHFFDAHGPYDPPEPYRSRVLARADAGPAALAPECQENLVLQRGEIEQLDALLGELRRALERRDPGLGSTLIVLAADHGECFGEGGFLNEHEASLFQATQRVVAVIRPPSSANEFRPGSVVSAAASQVDLVPTICHLSRLDAPEEVHGVSLVPAMLGRELASRSLYMEAFQRRLGDSRLHGLWQDGWKIVRSLDGGRQLYHDRSGDAVDLAAREPSRLALLDRALDEMLARLPVTESVQHELSPQDRRALQELGYVDG